MNKYLKIIGFSLFLLNPFGLKSQPLDTLLKEAINNNLDLKILQNQYLTALEKAPQVNKIPDFEAGLGLFPLPVETRLGPQVVRLSAAQMFPWFGTFDSKKELEKAKAKTIYEGIAVRNLDLIYEIKKAYLKLFEIEKSQSIIKQNIVLLDALERLAVTKVESGKSSTADVLRIQIKTQELQNELALLEAEKIEPAVEINQLLNRDLETKIDIEDEFVFAPLFIKKDTLFSKIQTNHPMIKKFEWQQQVSKHSIEVNKKSSQPKLGAGLDYIFVNPRSDANPSGNGRDIIQVKAMVKIPLYRKNYEAKEREEHLIIATLESQKAELLARFKAAIEKAFANHKNASLKYELYEQQLQLTKATINILETDYSTSGDNFDELLRLEKELIDYNLKKLRAIVQSHLAVFELEKYFIR